MVIFSCRNFERFGVKDSENVWVVLVMIIISVIDISNLKTVRLDVAVAE